MLQAKGLPKQRLEAFDELEAAERHAGGEVGDAAVHELSETQGAALGQDVPDLGGREPFAGGVATTVVFADAGLKMSIR